MKKREPIISVKKTNATPAAKVTSPPEPATTNFSKENAFGSRNDLEDLREIFWGNHIRATEGRFNAVEANLDTVNRTLKDSFTEKFTQVTESTHNNLTTSVKQLNDQLEIQSKQGAQNLNNVRQEINHRLDRQHDDHNAEIRKLNRELMEYVDQQSTTQATNLRQAQKEIGERIDKLATDLLTQLGKVQKELTQQITRLNEEQIQRINTARAESQKRDDDLRSETLKITTALEDKSAGRHDLAQLYMELGRRLYNS
ncbi:MAG: hypothetical protein GY943_34220 [Chloroflexi bacterium]|nr:hypothetical protein [Chloroflexota bacterium]